MKQISVTLDEETLEALERIEELIGTVGRSETVRELAKRYLEDHPELDMTAHKLVSLLEEYLERSV